VSVLTARLKRLKQEFIRTGVIPAFEQVGRGRRVVELLPQGRLCRSPRRWLTFAAQKPAASPIHSVDRVSLPHSFQRTGQRPHVMRPLVWHAGSAKNAAVGVSLRLELGPGGLEEIGRAGTFVAVPWSKRRIGLSRTTISWKVRALETNPPVTPVLPQTQFRLLF